MVSGLKECMQIDKIESAWLLGMTGWIVVVDSFDRLDVGRVLTMSDILTSDGKLVLRR